MRLLLCCGLALGLLACETRPETTRRVAPAEKPADGYELTGVLDSALHQTVAFALKKPVGWRVRQWFRREWTGPVARQQIYFGLQSPDSADRIEFLPFETYSYADGPENRYRRQYAQEYRPVPPPDERAPLSPVAYLRTVLLPELAKQGVRLRVTREHEDPAAPKDSVTTAEGYLEGTLADGRHARLSCTISQLTRKMGTETYTTWAAAPTLVQSRARLAAGVAHAVVGRKSLTVNPAWVKLNARLLRYQERLYQEMIQQRQQMVRPGLDRIREYALDTPLVEPMDTTFGRLPVATATAAVYRGRPNNRFGAATPIDAGRINWPALRRISGTREW